MQSFLPTMCSYKLWNIVLMKYGLNCWVLVVAQRNTSLHPSPTVCPSADIHQPNDQISFILPFKNLVKKKYLKLEYFIDCRKRKVLEKP
jgi:hypothetical protein